MPRANSLARMQQAVNALEREGAPITVRAVRARAGGGSFSTVSAFLRARRTGAAPPSPQRYAPVHKAEPALAPLNSEGGETDIAAHPRAEVPPAHSARRAQAGALEPTHGANGDAAGSGDVRELIEQLARAVQALGNELAQLRQSHAAQLALAYERYESVQKYALKEVDAARERAQDAQRSLRDAQANVRTREDAFMQQAMKLREELAFARGQLAQCRQAGGSTG